jgi:thiol-disulfide isomerase/thioredoxin
MVFIKINDDNKEKLDELKKYYSSKSKIFILIYMNGCGPCNATKPEWNKLENVLSKYKNNKDVVIVDIDKDVLEKNKIKGFIEPIGFPTIVFVKDKNFENYEDDDYLQDNKKDRSLDSFVEWIEHKVSRNEQNGGKKNKQNGGIFINPKGDPNALEHYLKNSNISVLLTGAYGITLKAELQYGATTSYKNLNQKNYGRDVDCLLIKLCCLYDKNSGETKKKLDFNAQNRPLELYSVEIDEFKNEINVQTDIFLKTCEYLQPLCPAIVEANSYTNETEINGLTVDKLLDILINSVDRLDKASITNIKNSYNNNEYSSLGVIAMEFASGYSEFNDLFYDLKDQRQVVYFKMLAYYALIELAVKTGYTHGDFHTSNIMINISNNLYFYGIPGQIMLIDFGYATKIEPDLLAEIKEYYANGEYMEIINYLCDIPRKDNVQMWSAHIYEWICQPYGDADIEKINNYIKNTLIPSRERYIDAVVNKFNKSREKYKFLPYLPLSNQAKNFLYPGIIGGKKNKKTKINRKFNRTKKIASKQIGGKWSNKYKRSINCKKPKGFSQKQYCKYSRRK